MTLVVQTPEQHTYLARLLGYDYNIQYRSGTHNQAADALSRLPEIDSQACLILSVPCLTFMTELHSQLHSNSTFQQQMKKVQDHPDQFPDFSIADKLLLYKGRIWLPKDLPIITTLLHEFHTTPIGEHAGIAKTIARLMHNFYWPDLRDDVSHFVTNCVDYQVTKYETKKSTGLLCPLPVPSRPWEDLSLDFIGGLPPYHGNSVLLVVVDRFSKGIHLGMLP